MDETSIKFYSATLEFLGTLMWPLMLLFVLLHFHPQIIQLLSRLGSVKVAGSEWVFQPPTPSAPLATKALTQRKLEVSADGFLNAINIHAAVMDSSLLHAGETVTGELLIFQSPRQRTWLVATSKSVFVLLDDEKTRQDLRLIQTCFEKAAAMPLEFNTGDGAGIVKFAAETRWWYYSLSLFPTPDGLKAAVSRLLLSEK
jgi:hypothetical protein